MAAQGYALKGWEGTSQKKFKLCKQRYILQFHPLGISLFNMLTAYVYSVTLIIFC